MAQAPQIIGTSTSKTGKHGHAKIHFIGTDIFTGKKLEDICPSTHNMEAPNVKRDDMTLMDIDEEGFLSLLLSDGTPKVRARLSALDRLAYNFSFFFFCRVT